MNLGTELDGTLERVIGYFFFRKFIFNFEPTGFISVVVPPAPGSVNRKINTEYLN